MKFFFFIGVDISKKTLDFAVRDQQHFLFHLRVDNSPAGLEYFKIQCLDRGVDLKQSLICCEHTGIYNQYLLNFTTQDGFSLWLESSIRIKRSLGLQRGKSDKVDAVRISEYALRYADKAVAWQPEREVLIRLRHLITLRKRLLTAGQPLPKMPLKFLYRRGLISKIKN